MSHIALPPAGPRFRPRTVGKKALSALAALTLGFSIAVAGGVGLGGVPAADAAVQTPSQETRCLVTPGSSEVSHQEYQYSKLIPAVSEVSHEEWRYKTRTVTYGYVEHKYIKSTWNFVAGGSTTVNGHNVSGHWVNGGGSATWHAIPDSVINAVWGASGIPDNLIGGSQANPKGTVPLTSYGAPSSAGSPSYYATKELNPSGYTDYGPFTGWTTTNPGPGTTLMIVEHRVVIDSASVPAHTVYYLTGGGSSATLTSANWTTTVNPLGWTKINERKVVDKAATPGVYEDCYASVTPTSYACVDQAIAGGPNQVAFAGSVGVTFSYTGPGGSSTAGLGTVAITQPGTYTGVTAHAPSGSLFPGGSATKSFADLTFLAADYDCRNKITPDVPTLADRCAASDEDAGYTVTVPADTAEVTYTTASGPGARQVTVTATIVHPLLWKFDNGLSTKSWTFDYSDEVCPTVQECRSYDSKHFTTLADWDLSETRTGGHNAIVPGGLHIWTDGNTSLDKAAGYYPAGFDLKDVGAESIDQMGDFTQLGSSTEPGLQLVIDFDDDGTADGILVGEKVYGNDWWLTSSAAAFVKASAPQIGGGFGSTWHGTIDEWLTAFPDAAVVAIGYSLGSGIHGDFKITELTFNCVNYTFGVTVDLAEADPWADPQQCVEGQTVSGSITVVLVEHVRYTVTKPGDLGFVPIVVNFGDNPTVPLAPGSYLVTAEGLDGYELVGDDEWPYEITVAPTDDEDCLPTLANWPVNAYATGQTCTAGKTIQGTIVVGDVDGGPFFEEVSYVAQKLPGGALFALSSEVTTLPPGTYRVGVGVLVPGDGVDGLPEAGYWDLTITASTGPCGDLTTLALTGSQAASGWLAIAGLLFILGAGFAVSPVIRRRMVAQRD